MFNQLRRCSRSMILALSLFVALSLSAHAQNAEIGARNLSNFQDAEAVASELISKTKAGEEVLLYHAGERIPDYLEYVVQRAALAKIPVKIVKISPDELTNELTQLEEAPESYQELLTYGAQKPVTFRNLIQDAKNFMGSLFGRTEVEYTGAWKTFGEKVKRLPNRLFGVPRLKDLSFWVKAPLQADPALKKLTRSRALTSALIGGGGMGLCYVITYLAGHKAMGLEILPPAMVLGSWVYFNMVKFRNFNMTMTQGKSLVPTAEGWEVRSNSPFFWSASFLRSIMTNALVMAAKKGPTAFALDSLEVNAYNSLMSVFSKSEIDRWIMSHAPQTRDANGNVVLQKGEWSERKLTNINFFWTTANGLIKNFSLVANDPDMGSPPEVKFAASALLGGITALNVGMMVKPVVQNLFEQAKAGMAAAGEVEPDCRTLLTVRTVHSSQVDE